MHTRWTFAAFLFVLAVAFLLPSAGCGSGEAEEGAVPANISGGKTNDGKTDPASPQQARIVSPTKGADHASPAAALAGPSEAELHPQVLIRTSLGDILLELDAAKAPQTVDNFLEGYVSRGYYDQTIFHYVDKGFMILGGGFTADLKPKPVRAMVFNEAFNGLKNRRGTVAMAREHQHAHSATSQFFINLVDNPSLDHKSRDSGPDYGYCVFGKVIQGMDVVDRIANVEVHDPDGFRKVPVQPVVIETVQQLR